MSKVCGNCAYNSYDRELREFYCGNTDSDSCGSPTAYDDSCADFESKED